MDSPLVGTARSEKILWYQEVLALDPDSRIFLPYARLLAELGRTGEAADVLKAGLVRHPEFLEARLLLIELLHSSGQENAAGLEADAIIDLLSRSPALWRIWSRRPGLRADQAAMMLFFASAMQKGGLSLSDIFEAGIAALEEKDVPADADKAPLPNDSPAAVPEPPVSTAPVSAAPSVPAAPAEHAASAEDQPPAQAFVMTEDTTWYSLDSVPEDDDIYEDDEAPQAQLPPVVIPVIPLPVQAEPTVEVQPQPNQPEAERVPAMMPVPRGTLEGKSSLCTRSMARVLEEQGATDEAADIYRELLENCSSDEERRELNAKLACLLQGADGTVPAPQTSSGILDMLETLADRLEKRSRA